MRTLKHTNVSLQGQQRERTVQGLQHEFPGFFARLAAVLLLLREASDDSDHALIADVQHDEVIIAYSGVVTLASGKRVYASDNSYGAQWYSHVFVSDEPDTPDGSDSYAKLALFFAFRGYQFCLARLYCEMA